MSAIDEIKDKRPKVIIIDYNTSYEDKAVMRYPKLPNFIDVEDEEIDQEANPEKDVILLAHAISTLIALHEQDGGNGAKLLRSAITQMESVFIDPEISVSKQRVKGLE